MTEPTTAASLPPPSVRRSGPSRRQLAERAERRRATVIAAISTVVVFTALAALVVTSPGWPKVRASFFDGERFRESAGDIIPAFGLNVRVFLIAEACILVLALLVALARS